MTLNLITILCTLPYDDCVRDAEPVSICCTVVCTQVGPPGFLQL